MPGEPAGDDKSRYETLFRLASGGMATVFVGTVRGAFGFRQLVAIKKPHAHLVADPAFRQALLREARLASLIHHANVVDVRDVEATDKEVSLVMDYVEGASLSELLKAYGGGDDEGKVERPLPAGVAVRIVLDACAGLHAAHEQTDERGRPLRLVHRDISPQNLLVGVDGLTRVADFGVAKFKRKAESSTVAGVLKGKLAYMAPEYVKGEGIDRRFDVFAMGVVLWEALTGQRLFRGTHAADTLDKLLSHEVPSVSTFVPGLGTAFDAIVGTALAKNPDQRFDNASAMAAALESSARAVGLLVGHREVAELVKSAVGPRLEERKMLIRARLAHEPSVASATFDPEAEVSPPHREEPPAATTIPSPKPPSMGEARSAGAVLHWDAPTLREEANAQPFLATLRSESPLEHKNVLPTTIVVSRKPPSEMSIVLPMKKTPVWPYAVAFVVITVAVAAAVVEVAQLRVSSKPAASAAAPTPKPSAAKAGSIEAGR